MNRYSLLLVALAILVLLLSACGPRDVEQVQPIKFEYTDSDAVAGLQPQASDFHPLRGLGGPQPPSPVRAV